MMLRKHLVELGVSCLIQMAGEENSIVHHASSWVREDTIFGSLDFDFKSTEKVTFIHYIVRTECN